MKFREKIVIYGAGGFGKEVQWLIERINSVEKKWEILGYIDDIHERGIVINGYPVLGGFDILSSFDENLNIVCAVGNSNDREKLVNRIQKTSRFKFPNLIDPSAVVSDRIKLGEGNLICAGTCATVDIEIGNFVIVNLDCTIGHDVEIGSFVTLYPSVNVSGNVRIGCNTEIGTGSNIIQGKTIGSYSIIGAGSVVIKDIPDRCTAVGIPSKPVKFFE